MIKQSVSLHFHIAFGEPNFQSSPLYAPFRADPRHCTAWVQKWNAQAAQSFSVLGWLYAHGYAIKPNMHLRLGVCTSTKYKIAVTCTIATSQPVEHCVEAITSTSAILLEGKVQCNMAGDVNWINSLPRKFPGSIFSITIKLLPCQSYICIRASPDPMASMIKKQSGVTVP